MPSELKCTPKLFCYKLMNTWWNTISIDSVVEKDNLSGLGTCGFSVGFLGGKH